MGEAIAARAVCLDVMGTLFDLGPLRERLERIGAPPLALEAWFARTLHTATAMTLAGEFRPFGDIAGSTLRSLLAQLALDPNRADEILAGLAELDPYPDAGSALQRLSASDLHVVALTNGTEKNTRTLLARAGIDRLVDRVMSTEEVGVYKPHRAVYEHAAADLSLAPAQLVLVAAHAWDVMGARAAGLHAIWVSRLERRWPLPLSEQPKVADLDAAAALILDGE
ncbi:MAG TPA: haloacid dehalogenase type II [Solirubrobacteraceae bacterium]|nr:haloacid dehalogenase type II [Solirubrobacteraceae bacterium]